MSRLDMTQAEREQFLADARVGIVCIARKGDAAPLAVPVWYDYQPGGSVSFVTGRTSAKARLAERTGTFTLVVQNEDARAFLRGQPPDQQYVSVSGPVTEVRSAEMEKDLRPMARRYLETEGGDQYLEQIVKQIVAAMGGDLGVVISMRPERWRTEDYTKM